MRRRRFRCCLRRDFGRADSELCLKPAVDFVSIETESVLSGVARSGHFTGLTDWSRCAYNKLTRYNIATYASPRDIPSKGTPRALSTTRKRVEVDVRN